MSPIRNLFFLLLFISCSGKEDVPKDIMKQEKMMAVMMDVFRADALTEERGMKHIDSAKRSEIQMAKYYKQVFDIHRISKEDFFKSYNYYLQHPDVFKIILDSVYARNERNKYKVYQKYSTPPKKEKNDK